MNPTLCSQYWLSSAGIGENKLRRYNAVDRKRGKMDEKTSRKPFEDRIPEEARQHMRAAREELRESVRSFLPPEFITHRRKARREMLLAWRSFIDRALERIDQKDSGTEN
jgi:hypothetical protein